MRSWLLYMEIEIHVDHETLQHISIWIDHKLIMVFMIGFIILMIRLKWIWILGLVDILELK